MESNCTLNHEHSKRTELTILHLDVTSESLSTMCESFINGHASYLEKLSKLSEVLDNKLCPELTYLELSGNSILDEGVAVLCNALIIQKQFKLTQLFFRCCSLTGKCIPSLCKLLRDKRCNLTVLSLEGNKGISDEGLRMLCEYALTTEHCKLAELYLPACSLTDKCIPKLCKALQYQSCKLVILSLKWNKGISDENLRICVNRL
jgi:Ran GTPase-activating protein (RanGAP) involved in mRNA processing and transport